MYPSWDRNLDKLNQQIRRTSTIGITFHGHESAINLILVVQRPLNQLLLDVGCAAFGISLLLLLKLFQQMVDPVLCVCIFYTGVRLDVLNGLSDTGAR